MKNKSPILLGSVVLEPMAANGYVSAQRPRQLLLHTQVHYPTTSSSADVNDCCNQLTSEKHSCNQYNLSFHVIVHQPCCSLIIYFGM